jgi:hypothetical protein
VHFACTAEGDGLPGDGAGQPVVSHGVTGD